MAIDPKQKKQLVILGIGIVILAIVLMINPKPKKKEPPKLKIPAGGATAVIPVPPPAQGQNPNAPKIGGFPPPDEKVILAQLKRLENEQPVGDPFYPLGDKITSKRGSLALKGISWKEKGPSYAIINEEIVRAGDMIGGSKLTNIERKRVTLEKDGQPYILILEE